MDIALAAINLVAINFAIRKVVVAPVVLGVGMACRLAEFPCAELVN